MIDSSWDAWSNCVCDHGLNVTEGTGLMYRIRKCHRACPNVPFCTSDIKFKTCSCAEGKSEYLVFSYPVPGSQIVGKAKETRHDLFSKLTVIVNL